ncbi:alpha/beta fold hydrolase [Kitasatospora sp. NPDC008115]|uniref:alpha/beta fold hydrolase n=1 Tax=Kitasatospora sp. NPDC008115 TaxID=3364022 RepID=UPI0036EECA77
MAVKRITANRIDFAYLELGDGPLALLTHGFPMSPATYRYLMPALADAGYRAVAPYLRGFAPSAQPPDGGFAIADLAADVNGLHEALGGDGDAVLIGHDFSVPAALGAAGTEADRWSKLVLCDVPPFEVFGPMVLTPRGTDALSHFWFFQTAAAEQVVAADDLAYIDWIYRKFTAAGFDATEDLKHAKDALRGPENLAAALALYRTTFAPDRLGTPEWLQEHAAVWGAPPTRPTLNLFGSEDPSFQITDETLAAIVEGLPEGSHAEVVQGVGHAGLVERPAEVNSLILRFLAGEL